MAAAVVRPAGVSLPAVPAVFMGIVRIPGVLRRPLDCELYLREGHLVAQGALAAFASGPGAFGPTPRAGVRAAASQKDHQLIRSGPYAYVRHPIYAGLLLALVATTLAIGEWGCVVSLCLMVLGFPYNAVREEALLARQFGDAFTTYQRQTGALIPRI